VLPEERGEYLPLPQKRLHIGRKENRNEGRNERLEWHLSINRRSIPRERSEIFEAMKSERTLNIVCI